MYKYSDIKKIHLEVTQKCQAACPMCDRNENGGKDNIHLTGAELTLEDCQKIFTPDFIKQLDVMYMCGNLGDPIVARDTLEIFKYFRQHNSNIWLSMNTNAGAKSTEWWRELAKVYGKNGAVIFSIDGLEDTNHMYRQNVNWKLVEQNFHAFIDAGGRARWDYIIFEHNQHQVELAQKLSIEWGFEKFVSKKTGRFITSNADKKDQHQAVNHKGKQTALLKKPDEKFQNSSLKKHDALTEKYGSMDAYFDVVPIKCKVKDEGNLFITAEGLALPCCWTAGRMYKWWLQDPKTEQIWNFIDAVGGKSALDARQGLNKVFETGIFSNIENSWTIKGCSNGKLKVCSMKCGLEFDPFGEQYK